jgi:chorismate dehydratase
LDLGSEWKALTGLPFVFALWVHRRGVDSGRLAQRLEKAYQRGSRSLEEIAGREAPKLKLDKEFCLRYLQNVRYRIGPPEEEGLRRFGEELKRI